MNRGRAAGLEERFHLVSGGREAAQDDFQAAVAAGLGGDPKSLPFRFLYDAEGSRLFEAICGLPEYYLTRAEAEILRERSGEIAALFEEPLALVELGSGSAEKTRHLIEALLAAHGTVQFMPVDISRSALEASARGLLADYPGVEIVAFHGEYRDGLERIRSYKDRRMLVLWLGSNVGNFHPPEAVGFLKEVRGAMAGRDRMLLGADLIKDATVLEAAYDDPGGVTQRFSLNLLARINRELGGGFDLAAFRHEARFDPEHGRVEIRIVSTRDQVVPISGLGLVVPFAAGEGIHTEFAYKYGPGQIRDLAGEAGFVVERCWTDAAGRFSENLLAPR